MPKSAFSVLEIDSLQPPRTNRRTYRFQVRLFSICTYKNELRRIEHRAQFGEMHKFLWPASPTLHALLVPCHRRCSFPGWKSLRALKFRRLSTSCLLFGLFGWCIVQGLFNLPVSLIFVSNLLRANYFIDESNGRDFRHGMSPGGGELFSHFKVL